VLLESRNLDFKLLGKVNGKLFDPVGQHFVYCGRRILRLLPMRGDSNHNRASRTTGRERISQEAGVPQVVRNWAALQGVAKGEDLQEADSEVTKRGRRGSSRAESEESQVVLVDKVGKQDQGGDS
jgi:hypothetical protein